jgi:hypothetical protein
VRKKDGKQANFKRLKKNPVNFNFFDLIFRMDRARNSLEEIPEWVKVSFLEFIVLLILWGFIYNYCKYL